MLNTFDEVVLMGGPITKWVSGEFMFILHPFVFPCIRNFSVDFTQQCLSTPEIDNAAASKATLPDDGLMLREILNSPTPTPLLSEWVKATLARRSWKEALVAASNVRISFYPDIPRGPDALGLEFIAPRSTIYRAVCERLETIERITDAIECFHGMANELAGEIQGKEAKWVLGE
jgi:hypothetical protein